MCRPGRRPYGTITNGISYPDSLAEGKSGKLYAGNYGSPSGSFTSTVTAYPHGRQSVADDRPGIFGPYTMAVDNAGRLYVANNGHDTVTEYHRGRDADRSYREASAARRGWLRRQREYLRRKLCR